VLVTAWIHATTVHQILIQAARDRDMTRSGVEQAALNVEVEFGGLAPDRNWKGDPSDYVVRTSYAFDVDASAYSPNRKVGDVGASNGFTLIEGPFVSPVAADVDYPSGCS